MQSIVRMRRSLPVVSIGLRSFLRFSYSTVRVAHSTSQGVSSSFSRTFRPAHHSSLQHFQRCWLSHGTKKVNASPVASIDQPVDTAGKSTTPTSFSSSCSSSSSCASLSSASSSFPESATATPSPVVLSWDASLASKMSFAFSSYPVASWCMLALSEACSVGFCYGVIKLTGMHFSSDFILAYLLHKLVGPTKYIIATPLAYLFSHHLPVLSKVTLPVSRVGTAVKLSDDTNKALQKYGLSFVLASRFVGMGTTFAIYLPLHYGGVDLALLVSSFNTYLGTAADTSFLVEKAATSLGELAAAVTLAGALFPFGLVSVLLLHPLFSLFRKFR